MRVSDCAPWAEQIAPHERSFFASSENDYEVDWAKIAWNKIREKGVKLIIGVAAHIETGNVDL